ncbi:ankyrin repeat domain-containing protein [Aspergillus mulundensis]|uniref:Uncharacterized protein n=1 Tax=Aspergillus mulundensis TaxID=1810919 RepID=A0A3D8S4Q7_9EURO|nr:hypothetical protein DSM5745_04840 [Aspergillus mulundensis]RDW81283.1 hypothetical protein DSM5745_04840 [Aspergillus mulundensis]
MSLLALPLELLLMIVGNLESSADLNALSQATKILYPAVSDILYRNNIKNENCSALFWAAREGSTATIERLFSYGVDVDARDEYEVTPLIYAAKYGHIAAADSLLQHGADLTKQTSVSPLRTFRPSDAYGPALFEAAREGRDEMVEFLLNQGADINHQRKGDLVISTLEAAISGGHSSTVQVLLDRGAGIESPGWYGTPLVAAGYYGSPDVTLVLLRNGANIENSDRNWGTALQTAAEERHKDVVQLLIDWGANVNAHAGTWGTALVSAEQGASPASEDIMELLIRHGADPAQVTEEYWDKYHADREAENASAA